MCPRWFTEDSWLVLARKCHGPRRLMYTLPCPFLGRAYSEKLSKWYLHIRYCPPGFCSCSWPFLCDLFCPCCRLFTPFCFLHCLDFFYVCWPFVYICLKTLFQSFLHLISLGSFLIALDACPLLYIWNCKYFFLTL